MYDIQLSLAGFMQDSFQVENWIGIDRGRNKSGSVHPLYDTEIFCIHIIIFRKAQSHVSTVFGRISCSRQLILQL